MQKRCVRAARKKRGMWHGPESKGTVCFSGIFLCGCTDPRVSHAAAPCAEVVGQYSVGFFGIVGRSSDGGIHRNHAGIKPVQCADNRYFRTAGIRIAVVNAVGALAKNTYIISAGRGLPVFFFIKKLKMRFRKREILRENKRYFELLLC